MARPGGFEAAEQQQQQQVLSRQQERHYRLLAELQALVKALPSACQQRLSYTTLSELALALLDGTVFEIVQGLLEIQHLTEKNLYSQRRQLHSEHRGLKQELFHRHKEAQQCCRPHNLPLLRAAQQREMEAMEQQIREEQRMMDEKIVLELDQKVIDQQSTLEKAGVSGFYITTNPQDRCQTQPGSWLVPVSATKKSLLESVHVVPIS